LSGGDSGVDGICDDDTIYGYVIGVGEEGANLKVLKSDTLNLVATITADVKGYYSIGNLSNSSYSIVSQNISYTFFPEEAIVQIPQTEIQFYDFTDLPQLVVPILARERLLV
jgi:hypothetical protein